MKKEEKKKDRGGGKEGVFIPPGSGVALAWGVLGCPGVSFRSPPISQLPLYNYLLYEPNPLLTINVVPRVV